MERDIHSMFMIGVGYALGVHRGSDQGWLVAAADGAGVFIVGSALALACAALVLLSKRMWRAWRTKP